MLEGDFIFNIISNLILPIMVLIVVIYGLYKKVDIYDTFTDGAKESFDMIFKMFPSLLGMILGINIFVKSGILDYLFNILKPILSIINIPLPVFPMMIMRPISGSSSLALLNNILANYGPDSLSGVLASIIQGSTDTTFYVLTLYFGSIGIKKIKYAMWAGLFADFIGIISSLIIVNFFL